MYYENKTIRVTGTFKPVLLLLGALAAPFAVFALPGGLGFKDAVWWFVMFAMLGALVGTIVGHLIDSLVDDFRQYRRESSEA